MLIKLVAFPPEPMLHGTSLDFAIILSSRTKHNKTLWVSMIITARPVMRWQTIFLIYLWSCLAAQREWAQSCEFLSLFMGSWIIWRASIAPEEPQTPCNTVRDICWNLLIKWTPLLVWSQELYFCNSLTSGESTSKSDSGFEGDQRRKIQELHGISPTLDSLIYYATQVYRVFMLPYPATYCLLVRSVGCVSLGLILSSVPCMRRPRNSMQGVTTILETMQKARHLTRT